jgi:alanine-glyoxylate transaminase/serine-glyoxylate transaminase/serine-pyruvate transaminase
LLEHGLDAVFARHLRWAEGVRSAVRAWGLPIQCADASVYSPILTGVMTPEGVDADAVRKIIHERFDCSLGTGLGKIKGKMFRIGHLGDTNDLTLIAALAGCEMGLKLAGVKLAGSGVEAGMAYFASHPVALSSQRAA